MEGLEDSSVVAFDAGNSHCNCRSAGEVSSNNLRIDFSLLPIAMETASHSCPSVLFTYRQSEPLPAESLSCFPRQKAALLIGNLLETVQYIHGSDKYH